MAEQKESDDLSDFLDRKGAEKVLFEIGAGAKRYNEIDEAVRLSTRTLAKRLDEGIELGLWRVETFDEHPSEVVQEERVSHGSGDHESSWVDRREDRNHSGNDRTASRYTITDRGRRVMQRMQELGLTDAIVKARTWETEVEELTGDLVDWVEKNEI
ncbi:hypothetical protein [Halobellus sp. EA9]|uniref:hypothetical protein n=1 Tax=Halobellus sp. EA9 TaxID=3421647 RepID=UPI003EBDE761